MGLWTHIDMYLGILLLSEYAFAMCSTALCIKHIIKLKAIIDFIHVFLVNIKLC